MPLDDLVGAPDADGEEDGLPVGGGVKAKKRRAVKRMFAAAKAGDWDGATEAFADAFEACEEYADDDEEAEGEAEGEGFEAVLEG
jgi:hypothetical protein